ncbi:MAG: helicase HerA domain-containing protein [Candidatus Caldarchaeales archaeon]
MIILFQIGIATLIFLFGVFLSGYIGGGSLTVIAFAASAIASIFVVRKADVLALSSRKVKASSLFAAALKGVESVEHRGDHDLLRLKNGKVIAVAAISAFDTRKTVDGSSPEELVSAVAQYGEIISSIGDVEVHIEVTKPPMKDGPIPRGHEPSFRFVIIAEGKSQMATSDKVVEAAKALAERLSTLGVFAELRRCDEPHGCGITALKTVKAQPLKVTKVPASLMLASSVIPLALSLTFAPNVFTLVLGLLMPPLFASYLSLRVASSMRAAGSVSPLEGEAEFVEGRLRIGNTYYSFATLRKIGHSDRFVEPEDVYRLLETLNSSFLYQRYGYTAVLALRKVDEAIFAKKETFKMDVSYYDYETGGGLSRALKAKKHQIKLERIRLGEKPYDVVGIFVLRTRADDVEAVKVAEDSFKSVLSLLGFSASYVRNPKGIMRCIRSIYLPADGVIVPVLEPASVSEVRALTLDFSWFSPFALDRIPLMVKDGIWLGHDHRYRDVYWNPKAVRNAHMAVLGPPGSGKSTLIRSVILRAAEYYRRSQGYAPLFLIVDPAGEYQEIAKDLGGEIVSMLERKVNPLLLEGASPHERAKFVAEMMKYLKGLKGEEVSALKEAILEAYTNAGIDPYEPSTWFAGYDKAVTFSTVYAILVRKLRESLGKPMEPVYRSLVDKLLDIAEGARAFNRTDLTVDELFRRGGVLCLSFRDRAGAMSDDLQRVVVWTVLQQVRDRLLSTNVQEDLRVMVVIDEAHRFVALGKIVEGGIEVKIEPPLSLHLRDTRKFGASYVLITHKPEDMPPGTIDLVGTLIVMSHPNNAYAEWAQTYLGLTESQTNALLAGGIGTGFMITTEDPRPLFVRFAPEKKALVRDAVADRMRALRRSVAVQKEEARETNVQRTKPEVVEKPEPQVKPILRHEAKRPEVVGLSKPQAEPVAREEAGNVNAWKSRPEAIEAREDQDYWTRPDSVKVAKKPEALDQRRCVTCGNPMPVGSDECPICAPRLRSPVVGVARKAALSQQPVSAPKPEPVVRAVSEQKEDVVVARRVDPSVEPSPKPKAVVPEPAAQKPEVPVEPAPRSEPSAPRPAPKPVAIPVSDADKPAPRVDHVSRTPAQTSQPRVKTVSLTGMVVVKPKTLPGVKPRSGGGSG